MQIKGGIIMSKAYRMINKNHPCPDSIKENQVGKRKYRNPKMARMKHQV